MHELGAPFSKVLELISIHSASKGALGECGMRGGYVQFTNCSPLFIMELYKLLSISLSPNVIGNVIVGLMVKPPKVRHSDVGSPPRP
jgi:glutamate--glyoxylate aminotransferase